MKSLILILTIIFFVIGGKAESDRLLVLPTIGYSDEQGLGLGANAAWLGIFGTNWSSTAYLLSSSLYNQLFLDAHLVNKDLLGFIYISASQYMNKSSRTLFYGTTNFSSLDNKSQLKLDDTKTSVRLGAKIWGPLTVGGGWKKRITGIGYGTDPTLPQYIDIYAADPRRFGTNSTSTELFFLYDTSQPDFSPESGQIIELAFEKAMTSDQETLAFEKFLASGTLYLPLSDKSFILASRVRYEHIWGDQIPFYSLVSLGGQESLRAFHSNRFVDEASFMVNLEPRLTIWSPGGNIFSRFDLSFAHEFGRVFSGMFMPAIDDYRSSWVFGLTGYLLGNIPLRLDYASGSEGSLIYLHLFLPF